MVNSGAIMSASILLHMVKKEMNMAQKYDYVLDFFKVLFFFVEKQIWIFFTIYNSQNLSTKIKKFFQRMAGGEYLGFNNSIFLSERDTADRNFALAYFLRENNCFPPPSPDINIPDILDFYFQVIKIQ